MIAAQKYFHYWLNNLMDKVFGDQRNTLQFQRRYWTEFLTNGSKRSRLFDYEWGDPEENSTKDCAGVVLGNYLFIKEHYLLPKIKNAVVLEIGSGGGKWTQYMKSAKQIICVDLSDDILNFLKRKLNWKTLCFYKTTGNELFGVENRSVDFIFSMDSLVRTPISSLRGYFREMSRVLVNGGEICLHLPCKTMPGSAVRSFVNLSITDIERFCQNNNLKILTIDKTNLVHGVILLARKKAKNITP